MPTLDLTFRRLLAPAPPAGSNRRCRSRFVISSCVFLVGARTNGAALLRRRFFILRPHRARRAQGQCRKACAGKPY